MYYILERLAELRHKEVDTWDTEDVVLWFSQFESLRSPEYLKEVRRKEVGLFHCMNW